MWDFIFLFCIFFFLLFFLFDYLTSKKKTPTLIFNEQKYDAIFFNVFIIPFVSSDGFIFVDMSQLCSSSWRCACTVQCMEWLVLLLSFVYVQFHPNYNIFLYQVPGITGSGFTTLISATMLKEILNNHEILQLNQAHIHFQKIF